MKNIKIVECPFCGSLEFVEGVHTGYGAINGSGLFTGADLYHQICRDCGSVVRSYVKNPEKLLNRKDRRK